MKTLNELYSEVTADEALMQEYKSACENGTVGEFLRAHECRASEDEVNAFLAAHGTSGEPHGELSDDELDSVAAGRKCGTLYKNGRPRVLPSNKCEKWTCYLCGCGAGQKHDRARHTVSPEEGVNLITSVKVRCDECRHYFGGLCMNPARYNN